MQNKPNPTLQTTWPSPKDPSPRWQPLTLQVGSTERVLVKDDWYSDRIRCDHPQITDGKSLGESLIITAREKSRSRIVLLAPSSLLSGLQLAGLRHEATMPHFYCGKEDCVVMGLALDSRRSQESDPAATAHVRALIQQKTTAKAKPRSRVTTTRATKEHAEAIAALIGETFAHYPTPSGVTEFVDKQITEGIPFRIVQDNSKVVACASADLVPEAKTAELTDCATHPDYRGQGMMQFILTDLIDDLRNMHYPTAFTLARAQNAGVNLAFLRLGFEWRGEMIQSCRIGGGLEDMNVWSRVI